MISAVVKDDDMGNPVLEVLEDTGVLRVIPMRALASYAELWGIADPVETLEAIISDQDREKVPGEQSPFGDAYALLSHREKAREEAAQEALDRRADKLAPADPRSPQLAGALAAYRAVHIPVAPGEECAMDRCRRRTRELSGVPFEPTKKCGATSRHRATVVGSQQEPDAVDVGPPTLEQWSQERRARFAELLSQVTWIVDSERGGFLHRLTGNLENPLGDTPPPVEPQEETVESVMERYGREKA